MTLPKSIRVAGLPIKIIRDNLSEDDCYGYYSHDRRAIVLEKTLTGEKLRTSFRHELMHAALNIAGIAFCKAMEEEAVIRCMDEVFFPAWERFTKRTHS